MPGACARSGREDALAGDGRITDAIYDAGYSGPGRFYADAEKRLGMTPSAWRDGGRGEAIRWATAETDLGTMLVAATEKGICRLSFDEDESVLRRRFPKARRSRMAAPTWPIWSRARRGGERAGEAARSAARRPGHRLPGSGLARAARIPPGETRTYAQIAAAVGRPAAVRAAGRRTAPTRSRR